MKNEIKFELIKANPTHSNEISKFADLTFRQTFCGIAYYTDKIIDGYAKTSLNPGYFASCLANPKHAIYLLNVNESLAGYLHVEETHCPANLKNFHGLFVHRIYIEASFKGRGLGKTLLEKAISDAKRLGYKGLWLGVWEFNQAAQAFYMSQGFEQVSEWDWAFESEGIKYVDRDLLFIKKFLNN